MPDQRVDGGSMSSDSIERELRSFLEERTKTSVEPTEDLFATGLVSSMFAMELVVHVEKNYQVAIVGTDLSLDNFRTVRMMTALVVRLREAAAVGGA